MARRRAHRGTDRDDYEEGSEYSIPDGDGFSENQLTETPSAIPQGTRDLTSESAYEFGSRVGFWRLMRMFAERDMKITVFGCALAFDEIPRRPPRSWPPATTSVATAGDGKSIGS